MLGLAAFPLLRDTVSMENWGRKFNLVQVRRRPAADREFWEKVGSHVYLTAEVAMLKNTYEELPPWEQATAKAAAVGLTVDTAVIAGKSAARLLGIAVLDWEPVVELMHVDGKHPGSRRTWPAGTTFRQAYLNAAEAHHVHGLRLTGTLRTLRDIACYHGVLDGVVAIDSARQRWPELTTKFLQEKLTEGPPYHGIRAVRKAIELSVPDSESALESKARWLLVTADLPGVTSIKTQVRISYDEHGSYFQVDILLNDWLIVEVDGAVKYDGFTYGRTDQIIRDERQREKILQNLGKVVIRVANADLNVRPDGGCGMFDLIETALANFVVPVPR